ncbi:MAG: hypothetical protein Q9163_001800 [Psora crenata]
MAPYVLLALATIALTAPPIPDIDSTEPRGLVPHTPLYSPESNTPIPQPRDASPPFVPPPISLPDGGKHTWVSLPTPVRRIRDFPSVAKSPPSGLSNGGAHSLVAVPPLRHERRYTSSSFVPSPLSLPTGGEHTMAWVPRPSQGECDGPSPTPTEHAELIAMFAWPGGPGIPITEQRQLVMSYVEVTSCASSQPTNLPSQQLNAPLAARSSPAPPNIPAPIVPPHDSPALCTISLSPTITPICRTILSPLAAPPILITACDQYITYRSEYGYTLIPATHHPTATGSLHSVGTALPPRYAQLVVQTLTTFSAAVWTDVTPSAAPTGVTKEVICVTGECRTDFVTRVVSVTNGSVSSPGGETTQAFTPVAETAGADGEDDAGPTTTVSITSTRTKTLFGAAAAGT